MTTSEPKPRLMGGRYRIDRPIGAGAMGTVWAGRDELLDRQVAVKEVRLPAEVGEREQADLRERTLREARATARLSHPNVVMTYDVVEEDGRPWIVMELLPSRSLSAVLREDGPMPPHRVADLGLAMLGALEVAHQQGIVHRDVKPGNVLITPDGRPVLTDFEGRPPYDSGSALSTLTAVISDPVEPPTAGGPLRDAILGLLEKDPAERLGISSTRELLTRAASDRAAGAAPTAAGTVVLDRAILTEALPPAAPPRSTSTEYGRPTPRRGRRSLAVAAGLVVLLLLGLGSIGLTASRSGTQVKFTEPGTTRYLLVDQTDSPREDPKADWERQETSFASGHANYQRISIESVQYRDYPTADWRFTYATRTQVVNRGFVAGDKGYALHMSGPRDTWPESEQIFSQAAETFAPAGD